jgi:hypothetical protein
VRLAEQRGEEHIGGSVEAIQKLRQRQKISRKAAQRGG